jgi:hypothetical protein
LIHGDLIEMVLSYVPEHRIGSLTMVLIDPSDSEFPIGFNLLKAHTDNEELLASDLVALFRRFFNVLGNQMNSVLCRYDTGFLESTQRWYID